MLNEHDRVTQDLVHLRDKVSEKSFSLSSTVSAAENQTKLFKGLQRCHTDGYPGGAGWLLGHHQCELIDHKVVETIGTGNVRVKIKNLWKKLL